jgi:hypothetical protein
MKKLLDIMNETTVSGSIAAGPAVGLGTQRRVQEEDSDDGTKAPDAPKAKEFGLWKNSVLAGAEQRDKKKSKKVAESKSEDRNEMDTPAVQSGLKKMAARHNNENWTKEQLADLGRRLAAVKTTRKNGYTEFNGIDKAIIRSKKVNELDCGSGQRQLKLAEENISEEQLLAKELARRLDLFMKGLDRELGKKSSDRGIQSKTEPSTGAMREDHKTIGPDMTDPYEQGWRAGHRGDFDCPYKMGTEEYEQWQTGFEEADAQRGHYNESVAESTGQQLSIQQLATISDEALDNAYHYGRSSPGNTFGWQANLKSAAYAKQMIDKGITDIEAISDAIHKGWNVTAKAFVQNPDQFDDTEKLKAAGKLEAKLQQREKLMNIGYAQLPDEEQEKDRVVARALLQALKGQQGVAETTGDTSFDSMMGKIVKGARYKGAAADQRADTAYGSMMNNITKNAADVAKPSANSKFEQVYSAVERILLSNNVHWDIDDDILDALKKLKIKASDDLMQKLERELINRVSDALQYYDDSDLAEQAVSEDSDPCWDNYKQVGMKKKNGKKVPNCVPKKGVAEGIRNDQKAKTKIIELMKDALDKEASTGLGDDKSSKIYFLAKDQFGKEFADAAYEYGALHVEMLIDPSDEDETDERNAEMQALANKMGYKHVNYSSDPDLDEGVAEGFLNEHGDPWEDPDYEPYGSGKETRSSEQIAKDRAEHAILSKKLGLSNKRDKDSMIGDMTKMLNHFMGQHSKKKDVAEASASSSKSRAGLAKLSKLKSMTLDQQKEYLQKQLEISDKRRQARDDKQRAEYDKKMALKSQLKDKDDSKKDVNEATGYKSQFPSAAPAIQYAKDKVKTFRDPDDGIEIWSMPDGGCDVVHTSNSNGRNHCIDNRGKKLGTIRPQKQGNK